MKAGKSAYTTGSASVGSTVSSAALRLRAVEPEDLEFLYRVENDATLWEVSQITGPYSRYQLKQYIANNRNDFFADQELRLILEVEGEAAPVGILDFCHYNALNRRAEVGILIASPYRRRGYGLQALQWATAHAFGPLGLHQLYAYVAADNEASLQLFRSAGYRPTAQLSDWVRQADGTYVDVVLMQLLRTE